MRKIVIASIVLAAALVAGSDAGNAQTRRFCTERPVGSFGFPICAYDTWEQCLAAASGTGQHCTENSQYVPPAKAKAKKKRRR